MSDEREELEKQINEMKTYLAEISSERLIIEATLQTEVQLYVMQLQSSKPVDFGVPCGSEKDLTATTSAAMDIEQPDEETLSEEAKLIKKVNDRDTITNYESKI